MRSPPTLQATREGLGRWLGPWLGAGVGLLLVAWVLGRVDFARLATVLAGARLTPLAALPAALLLEQWLRGVKWAQILSPTGPVSVGRLFGAVLAGQLASHTVALGSGPLLRAWLVARCEGLRLVTVLASMITDRLVDGLAFLAFAGGTVLLYDFPAGAGPTRQALQWALALASVVLAGVLALFWLARQRPPLLLGWRNCALARLPQRPRRLLEALAGEAAAGLALPRAPARRWLLVACALAAKVVAVLHFYWAGLAFGVRLDAGAYVFVMVFLGFLVLIAAQLNLVGALLAGAVFALRSLGVEAETALAMTLAVQTGTLLTFAAGGAAAIWRFGLRLRDLPRAGEDTARHA